VCPACGAVVIRRVFNEVTAYELDANDRCKCGKVIPIRR